MPLAGVPSSLVVFLALDRMPGASLGWVRYAPVTREQGALAVHLTGHHHVVLSSAARRD